MVDDDGLRKCTLPDYGRYAPNQKFSMRNGDLLLSGELAQIRRIILTQKPLITRNFVLNPVSYIWRGQLLQLIIF